MPYRNVGIDFKVSTSCAVALYESIDALYIETTVSPAVSIKLDNCHFTIETSTREAILLAREEITTGIAIAANILRVSRFE